MNSRYFYGVIIVLCHLTANAQEGFRIGPSAMFLASRSSVNDTLFEKYNFRFKSGYNIGLTAQYGFSKAFGMSTGASFCSKGYRVFNDTNRSDDRIRHNFYNLEIPLNMYYSFRSGLSKIRIQVGGTLTSVLSKSGTVRENENKTFIIREEVTAALYPMANLGLEVAKTDKAGNAYIIGAYFRQSFQRTALLHIYNGPTSNPELFSLGYRGTYIGIGFSYLFNLKNLRKEEQFFY